MRPTAATVLLLLLATPFAAIARDDDDEEPAPAPRYKMHTEIDFDGLSVSPGGAEDITFFRDRALAGEVPHPNVFTPEGLFSEHDLPIAGARTCEKLICPVGRAVPTSLLVQPEVRYLAQLGFDTNLDARTFRRAPLNLVAVIDKSGSMSGQPLEMVKASLLEVVEKLGPTDQLSIVLYGDQVHTWLAPTSGSNRAAIRGAIAGIHSAGSTNMEAGLGAGFELAQRTAPSFDGTTRVMLFTDERPNVGRTDATSFMGMAEAAARSHVGMTTIGVGVQFGAELATKVASVRGGNLHFFADVPGMKAVFAEKFDTMVTELAHDMQLVVTPAPGLKVAGVYGIPGDAMRWEADGSIRMSVATLFPSADDGAIYFAFAPEDDRPLPSRPFAHGESVARVAVDYATRSGAREPSTLDMTVAPLATAGAGLTRGVLLVDEVTTLKKATALHHEQNDQEGAYQLVHALASNFRGLVDPDLAEERLLVLALEATLGKLSGHQGEPGPGVAARDPVTGLPRGPR